MKITIEQVAGAGAVALAIEAACKDHSSIASGVIGFSGHGSYHVTAADSIGLSLTIGLREE
jgi:hypothetical protein